MTEPLFFQRPYKSKKILSEKNEIAKSINLELKRIKKLLPVTVKMKIEGINTGLVETLKKDETFNAVTSKDIAKLSGDNSRSGVSAFDNAKNINKQSIPKINIGTPNTSRTVWNDFITNIPDNIISVGYNCEMRFTSEFHYTPVLPLGINYSTFTWYIIFDDGTGIYNINSANCSFLGLYSKPKRDIINFTEKVQWDMYNGLYLQQGYPSAKFKIAVQRYDDGQPGPIIMSDEVVINFNGAMCIEIHDMHLSHTEITGGNHGRTPTLYLNLNNPAPPTGITVYLQVTGVSDSNPQAWINDGYGTVTINAGQTHGEWEGFLGSRKVRIDRNIHVKAIVNGREGVSRLTITK